MAGEGGVTYTIIAERSDGLLRVVADAVVGTTPRKAVEKYVQTRVDAAPDEAENITGYHAVPQRHWAVLRPTLEPQPPKVTFG